MNDLAIFNFNNAEVRTVENDGEVWFIAGDIAAVLDYDKTSNMLRILDDDEKGAHIVSTLGGSQTMLTISESGLYACILKSRRDEAKAFRRWVTHDVLPSIRKTGKYDHEEFLRVKAENEKLLADNTNLEASRDYWRDDVLNNNFKAYSQGVSEGHRIQKRLARDALKDLDQVDKYIEKQRSYGFDDFLYRHGTKKAKEFIENIAYSDRPSHL